MTTSRRSLERGAILGLILSAAIAGGCGRSNHEQVPGAVSGQTRTDGRPVTSVATTSEADTSSSTGTAPAPAPAPRIQPAPTPLPPERFQQTPSGLRYADLVVGEGPTPKTGQIVRVHYTGWLSTGRPFDSSAIDGQPLEFPLGVGRVIRGWHEGIATMRVGGKRQLIVPPQLAFGDRSPGGIIPAGATLTFEVELVGIR